MDSVLILTEFSEAVMTCLKLLLYFTHITASLWVVIMSLDDILKNTTNVRDLENHADVKQFVKESVIYHAATQQMHEQKSV